MKYFVVIPIFNEVERISEVIKQVKKFTKNIIVVDDGSIDVPERKLKNQNIIFVRHKVNLGKGAALKTGCQLAFSNGADFVITLDGDGQHNPVYIADFVKKIKKGNDIVFGIRQLNSKMPLIRKMGNQLAIYIIKHLFGMELTDLLCGFRAFTKKAYNKIYWESVDYGVETEIVAKTGRKGLKYATIDIPTTYIDKYKGVTIFDAISILINLPAWKFF